jgi:hypothetical protein
MDDFEGMPQSGGYSPAQDSQQANVDMGQGNATSQFSLTDKQKLLAAQALQKAFQPNGGQVPTFAAQRSAPTPYTAGGGTIYTGGR